jgi:hypothetical protein
MSGKGQYRTRGADDASHTVFVNDRSISFNIGEQLYRWRMYEPPFEELSWIEPGETPPPRPAIWDTKRTLEKR